MVQVSLFALVIYKIHMESMLFWSEHVLLILFFLEMGQASSREFKSPPVAGPWNRFYTCLLKLMRFVLLRVDGRMNVLPIFWDYFGFKQCTMSSTLIKTNLSQILSLVSIVTLVTSILTLKRWSQLNLAVLCYLIVSLFYMPGPSSAAIQ